MKPYKEFQFGWWIFIVLIPIQVYFAYAYFNEIADNSLGMDKLLILNGTFFLIYLLFYGMTIKVDSERVKISFGLGLIRKTIMMDEINTIEIITNPWYYGWGIRLIPNGWLYNISGSNGIEIKLNDRKRIVRIGTKDSVQLKNEIRKRKHITNGSSNGVIA